ncbi:MAG: hypothetical protein LBH71_00505 [Oscillospiraceae bacterium]|jgi:hypothetical protein|nr:hypothetical protein [Oscillospiraceae bacterium]
MIKGVNMQVLEIKDTGNDYFDRVLLFVKPEHSYVAHDKLQKQALNLIQRMEKPPQNKRIRKKKLEWRAALIKTAAALAVGSGITAAIITNL